jgi:flagellar hook-associated protein 3 FlgL
MRISTNTLYELGVSAIQQRTADLIKTQQQLASGRRILAPSDDPVGASQALQLTQSLNVTEQYKTNIAQGNSQLSLEESVLAGVTRVIQDVKVTAINAGNPTLSSANLQALATELSGRYQELLGLANSKDGQGQYMFAGFKGTTQPFTQSSGAGVYAGDQGQRAVQISASRQVTVSDTGQDLFKPGVTGEDVFETLDDLITQLNSGSVTQTQLSTALTGFETALDNVLRVRSSVGARLRELESTDGTHEESALQYKTTISDLQDLDYTKAITDLTRTQTSLEAAQKSYVAVQQLSLFNYIGS